VEVVDGCEGTQTIVTKPEVWASCLSRHMQRKQEALLVNPLRQMVQNTGNKKNMAIFNRAHLPNSKTGISIKNTQIEKQIDWRRTGIYINCNHIGSTTSNSDWGTLQEEAVITATILKLEEHLLLANFGEIELGSIKWLKHTIHTELCRALLQVAPFIQLGNKPKVARDHLGLTCSDIISK
jgi:hypothetical protein